MKYSKVLILLLVTAASLLAQFNSARIAYWLKPLPIPANYLQRASNAGYTHIMAAIGAPISGQWVTGEYVGGSGTGTPVDKIRQAFLDCNNTINSTGVRLRFIPVLPGAEKHTSWVGANNPEITYQYYKADLIQGIATNNLQEDDALLDLLANLMKKDNKTEEYKVTMVPSYAPNVNGFDKTFKSLIEDVIKVAFDATGLPSSEFDYIHFKNDEPVTYETSVPKEWKLQIGKSQEDLKWMYDINTVNHFGIIRYPISTDPGPYLVSTLSPLNEDGRTTRVYSDYVYVCNVYDPMCQIGLRALIANFYQRRVQDVVDANLSPNIKCITFADIFDPEHLGGYFQTDQTVPILAARTVNVAGVAQPLTSRLVMMPWQYTNTWTHAPEGKFTGAVFDELLTPSVVRLSAGWLACESIFPDPAFPPFLPRWAKPPNLPKIACQALVTKWVVDEIYTNNTVDMDLEYDATGNYYDLENVMNHFMNSGFQFILANSFEKEYATVHTLAQIIKVLEVPQQKLTTAQKNSFMLGYACSAYGNEPSTAVWNPAVGPYDQHFIYNNMELISAFWNWSGVVNTQLMFGEPANIPPLSIACTRNPISVTDYFVTVKDPFNTFIAAPANSNMKSASFFEAILFCNQLSLREGLEPVYTIPLVMNNSLWATYTPTMSRNSGVSGPIILDANILADFSKNGYRLPTVTEMATIDADPQFIPDPVSQTEWAWNATAPRNKLYSHTTQTTITPSPLSGQAFRVVRQHVNTPPTAVATATPGSGFVPLTVAFSSTGSTDPDGDPLSFSWAFGDGATGTGASINHIYSVVGTYTAVLTVTDGNGGSNNRSVVITVNPPPPPNRPPTATITATPVTGSAALSVAFSGTGSTDPDVDPLTFSWNFGDGTTGAGLTVNHVYILAGTYTAVLTVSDGRGGSGTASRTITVTPSATLIPGTGSYPVTPAGVTYRINNPSYLHGMMFTIRNLGLDDAVEVRWFGLLDQNNSNCVSRVANLNGNGAQITNICTPKNSSNDMYVSLKSSKNCSVRLEVFNWINGPGCL